VEERKKEEATHLLFIAESLESLLPFGCQLASAGVERERLSPLQSQLKGPAGVEAPESFGNVHLDVNVGRERRVIGDSWQLANLEPVLIDAFIKLD